MAFNTNNSSKLLQPTIGCFNSIAKSSSVRFRARSGNVWRPSKIVSIFGTSSFHSSGDEPFPNKGLYIFKSIFSLPATAKADSKIVNTCPNCQ